MTEDPRCCGSGTCIINPAGRCWCGQQWDGEKMCFPALNTNDGDGHPSKTDSTGSSAHNDQEAD